MGAVEDKERFSITNSGELILKDKLDYERRVQHSFLVHVTDGHHVRIYYPLFKLPLHRLVSQRVSYSYITIDMLYIFKCKKYD